MTNRTTNVAGPLQVIQVTLTSPRTATLAMGTRLVEIAPQVYVPPPSPGQGGKNEDKGNKGQPPGKTKSIVKAEWVKRVRERRFIHNEYNLGIIALLPVVPAEHFVADPTGKVNQLRIRTTRRYRTVGVGAFLSRTRSVSRTHAVGVQGIAGEKYHEYEDITLPLTLAAQGDYPFTYRTDPDITDPDRSKQWMIYLGEDG